MRFFLKKTASHFGELYARKAFKLSLLSALLIIGFSSLFLSLNTAGVSYNYTIGEIAKENVRVPWDIHYHLEKETEVEKKRALLSVPLVFDMNRYVLLERIEIVNDLFSKMDSVLKDNSYGSTTERAVRVEVIKKSIKNGELFTNAVISAFITYGHRDRLRLTINRILNDIYSNGILEEEYANPLAIPNSTAIVRILMDNNEYREESRELESFYTFESLEKKLNPLCQNYTEGLPNNQRWAIYLVIKELVIQNLRFNPEETKTRMTRASESVKPVMGLLKKGQILVREGDAITTDSLKRILILNNYTSKVNVKYIAGVIFFQTVFFFLLFLFMDDVRKFIIPDVKAITVTTLLLVSFFAEAFLMYRTVYNQDSYLFFTFYLPIPFIVMICTILFNVPLAMVCGLYLVFYTVTLVGGDYTAMVIASSSVFLSIFAVKKVEKRFDFIKTGLLLGSVNSLLIIAIGFMREISSAAVLANIQFAYISAIGNTIAAMGLFPIFEQLFKMTTRFKLYELSDLNAPIFKDMLIKAPGTYNHSILVANMSEAACKQINANAILARVGSYYHDIGKIANAHIFTENKKDDVVVNLSPQSYTKKIIDHVIGGEKLARKHNLPEEVIDFIKEHHGESTVSYFYHQALEVANQNNKNLRLNESDFSYPGPKPRSKETAVVMLADSIEAASRSIKKPNETKLKQMVDKIIYDKYHSGELDECNLTIADITQIKEAFLSILNGIFHTRIQYPEKRAIKTLERKVKKRQV